MCARLGLPFSATYRRRFQVPDVGAAGRAAFEAADGHRHARAPGQAPARPADGIRRPLRADLAARR